MEAAKVSEIVDVVYCNDRRERMRLRIIIADTKPVGTPLGSQSTWPVDGGITGQTQGPIGVMSIGAEPEDMQIAGT
jgi:hypothetical protein